MKKSNLFLHYYIQFKEWNNLMMQLFWVWKDWISLSMESKRHPETSYHSYNIMPCHNPNELHQFHCGKSLNITMEQLVSTCSQLSDLVKEAWVDLIFSVTDPSWGNECNGLYVYFNSHEIIRIIATSWSVGCHILCLHQCTIAPVN